MNEHIIYLCALWIAKVGRDNDRIRFWSQVLSCKHSRLESKVITFGKLLRPTRSQPVTDDIAIMIFNEIGNYTTFQCKSIFNNARKTGE